MRAGALRDRVTIQAFTSTRDTFGQEVEAWADVATVWAHVRFLNGREFISADRQVQQAVASIRIRRREVTPSMRIVFDGDTYNITAVLPGSDRVYVDLAVTAGVADG